MMNSKHLASKLGGLAAMSVLWAAVSAPVGAVELLSNGDFSAGLAGWTVTDQAGGAGSWYADTVGSTTPVSALPTSALGGGAGLYVVSDQTGPGTHALTQGFLLQRDLK